MTHNALYGREVPISGRDKQRIRKRVLEERGMLLDEQRHEMSEEIMNKLKGLPEYEAARTICCYLSTGTEVETLGFVEKVLADGSKKIVVPFMDEGRIQLSVLERMSDLKEGAYKILEPIERRRELVAVENVDMFIVPGIAFSRDGMRIGRGYGHYDMLLKDVVAPRIAFAYDNQIVSRLSKESHDVLMTKIVTNLEVITCGKNP